MTPYIEPMASAYQANKSRRPQAAIKAGLFNHLVGAGEQRRRHVEAERLGSREVDHQFVFDRRLHRQVGWLLALEDTVDVAGGTAILVTQIAPVGDQAAGADEVAEGVDRRKLVPGASAARELPTATSPTAVPGTRPFSSL